MIVFNDDDSSDPTHSMLSKDHFSNVLNEPAGKVASQVLKWVVPQLIACWDDERIDINRTLTRVINGVFHHPALRDYGDDGAVDGRRLMFGIVESWWAQKDEQDREVLRDQLSRDGVEQGRNHKEGVVDSGHGCGKPLGMPNMKTAGSSGAIGGLAAGSILGDVTSAFSGESKYDVAYSGGEGYQSGGGSSGGAGKIAGEAVGGGVLGGIVGGLVGGLGGNLLGDAFGNSEKKTQRTERYEEDGSYTQSVTQSGYSLSQYDTNQPRYGQAEYTQTSFSSGGQREEYRRYEQDSQYDQGGYGQQIIQESQPTYGSGYEQTTERRYEQAGGEWQSEIRREGRDASGETYEETKRFEGEYRNRKNSSSSNSDSDKEKKYRRKYGDDSGSENVDLAYGERQGGFNDQQRSYGEEQSHGGSRQDYGQREQYESETRFDSRTTYESGGFEGGGEGYGSERIDNREGSFGRQEDEDFSQRGRYQSEEQTESYGDDRGYGQADEYQDGGNDEYGERRY